MGDEAVQSTNDDATLCKQSAVRLGYWRDQFIGELVRQQGRERRESSTFADDNLYDC